MCFPSYDFFFSYFRAETERGLNRKHIIEGNQSISCPLLYPLTSQLYSLSAKLPPFLIFFLFLSPLTSSVARTQSLNPKFSVLDQNLANVVSFITLTGFLSQKFTPFFFSTVINVCSCFLFCHLLNPNCHIKWGYGAKLSLPLHHWNNSPIRSAMHLLQWLSSLSHY